MDRDIPVLNDGIPLGTKISSPAARQYHFVLARCGMQQTFQLESDQPPTSMARYIIEHLLLHLTVLVAHQVPHLASLNSGSTRIVIGGRARKIMQYWR